MRFEPRRVEDIHFPGNNGAFKRVNEVSDATEDFYKTFVSPWVQALSNPWTAEAAKWLHPMRVSRYLFSSSFAPWLHGLAGIAETVRKTRGPLPADHPMLVNERAFIARTTKMLEAARKRRDATLENTFDLLYRSNSEREGHATLMAASPADECQGCRNIAPAAVAQAHKPSFALSSSFGIVASPWPAAFNFDLK